MTQETDQLSHGLAESPPESTGDDGGSGLDGARAPSLLVYSRQKLLELRPSHLCSIKPASFAQLEKDGVNCLRSVKKKKPTRCVYQKSDSRYDAKDGNGAVKRSGDPRERLKSEEEGIVLSPQRRSFVSGCHAPSIKLKDDDAEKESGQSSKPMRRMGSGRMIPRDEMRSQGRGVLRYERYDSRLDKSDHRHDDKSRQDRRVASRDWQHSTGGAASATYNRQRRGNCSTSFSSGDHRQMDTESQPEWFSEGPTSQLEMIELCGFDPPEDKLAEDAKDKEKRDREKKERRDHGKSGVNAEKHGDAGESAAGDDKLPPSAGGAFLDDPAISSTVQQHRPIDTVHQTLDQLALDDILRLDLDSLQPTAATAQPAATSSRFRQWFRERTPSPGAGGGSGGGRQAAASDSVRVAESQPTALCSVADPSSGLSAMSVAIGSGSADAVFAPISPASGTRALSARDSVIDAVSRAPCPQPPAPLATPSTGPLFDSLALASKLANMASGISGKSGELEAERDIPVSAPAPRNDADALQRLMRQLCESDQPARLPSAAADNPDALSVHQSTVHTSSPSSISPAGPGHPTSMPVNVGSATSAHMMRFPPAVAPPGGRGANQQHVNVAQENLLRLLYVQHQQQQHQVAAAMQVPTPAPTDQLLATADARAVLSALQSGRVTRQHLIQQLHTKNLPTRTRDVLVAVLRLPQQLPVPPSAVAGPSAGVDPVLLSQQQAAPPSNQILTRAVSPLLMPPHNVHQQPAVRRVPSPQEMRVHTQNILQSALIKQKLEEQKENFRRRQVEHRHVEMMLQQQDPRHRAAMAPGPVLAPSAASALAFTPTAVIRNMQSEARASPEHRPPGRAIVKSSMNGPEMAPPPGPWPMQQSAVGAGSLSRWFGSQLISGTVAPPSVVANPRVFSVEEIERHHRFA